MFPKHRRLISAFRPLSLIRIIPFGILLIICFHIHDKFFSEDISPGVENYAPSLLNKRTLEYESQALETHSEIVPAATKPVARKRRYIGGRPWFMTGGVTYPTHSKNPVTDGVSLWYNHATDDDRIFDQLMYAIDDPINVNVGVSPPNRTEDATNSDVLIEQEVIVTTPEIGSYSISKFRGAQRRSTKIMNILLIGGWNDRLETGRHVFLHQKCPVNACRMLKDYSNRKIVDVVLVTSSFSVASHASMRKPEQLWISYQLEAPTHSFAPTNGFVNLTATYRHDSDIVAPYAKWVYFDDAVRTLNHSTNFAAGKSKKVAMLVSNCSPRNSRMHYAKELGKYIQVDIYGSCGTLSCPRSQEKKCFEMLSKDYKFYLAFENSNCRDYITEKFFMNGLGNIVIPIALGAHPNDYARSAPPHSYIHVDDFSSPEELAKYLHKLDKNDDLYNEYFQWKGTGEFINTFFFCRLCAMAHYAHRYPKIPSYYQNDKEWWSGEHVCTRASWKSVPDIFAKPN